MFAGPFADGAFVANILAETVGLVPLVPGNLGHLFVETLHEVGIGKALGKFNLIGAVGAFEILEGLDEDVQKAPAKVQLVGRFAGGGDQQRAALFDVYFSGHRQELAARQAQLLGAIINIRQQALGE